MTGVADRMQAPDRRRQVLAIVANLAAERHALEHPVSLSTDTWLEGDLGLFSLERIELALRLEAATGLAFDSTALEEACTVGDVIDLACGARPAPRALAVATPSATVAHTAVPASMPFTLRVAVLLAAVGIALRLRLLIRPGADDARRALGWGARTLLRTCGAVPTVSGLENLEGQLPAVLVANHRSYVDTAVLLAALPVDGLFIANERLRGAPLLGAAISAAGYLVVDRTTAPGRASGASAMTKALLDGHTLIVFPEGTIEQGSDLGRFRLGAFAAAAATGRTVIPVTIGGTRQVLPLGRWTLARGPLSVTVHPPLVPSAAGWPETVRLARRARQVIADEQAAVGSGPLGVHDRGEPHQRA
jgi:1-acyl-sn-glycerol-3-phosphate acyltransferase